MFIVKYVYLKQTNKNSSHIDTFKKLLCKICNLLKMVSVINLRCLLEFLLGIVLGNICSS